MSLLHRFPADPGPASACPPALLPESRRRLLGGKAATLVELAESGFPVPPGIVLDCEFFAPWFADLAATPAWAAFVGSQPASCGQHCTELQALLLSMPWTTEQQEALDRLASGLGHVGDCYAVRSSAADEDLGHASFAGSYLTRLGVSVQGLEQAIRDCCASALDARVLAYRQASGLERELPRMAVIVQRQLPSAVAGVGFSLNPLSNDHDELVIDASPGLGEAVVAGQVQPDHWLVDRHSMSVLDFHAGDARLCLELADAGGVRERAGDRAPGPCLDAAQLAELAGLILRVEKHCAMPVDIEWAYAGSALYLLQARPITRYLPLAPELLSAPGAPRRLYADAALSKGLTMNAPVSTLGLDVLRRSMDAILHHFLGIWHSPSKTDAATAAHADSAGQPASDDSLLLFAGARMYMNLSPILWLLSPAVLARGSAPTDQLMARILHAVDRKRYRSLRRPAWLGAGLLLRLPRMLWRMGGLLGSLLATLLAPQRAHRRHRQLVEEVEARLREPVAAGLPAENLLQRCLDIVVPSFDRLMAALLVGQLSPRALLRLPDGEPATLAEKLEHGHAGNVVVEMGIALHRLAGLLDRAELADAGSLSHRIEARQMPAPFLAAWDDFRARYGGRGPQEMDLASPRFGDDPSLLLGQMAQLTGSKALDPAVLHLRQAREREQALTALLQGLGPLRRALLRAIHRRQLLFAGARDTPKHLLLLGYRALRRRWLEEGRQLARSGRLDDPADIFDLKIEEICSARSNPALDLRALRAPRVRHARLLRACVRSFPQVIDSRGRILRPRPTVEEPGVLRGMGVSAGTARGPVKLLGRADEKPIEPGDVLVAHTTDPGWTPLFVNACAIVLEVGGMLQHGAVVAREYGKPCVVGIERISERLRDGELVEVDGASGSVRRLAACRA